MYEAVATMKYTRRPKILLSDNHVLVSENIARIVYSLSTSRSDAEDVASSAYHVMRKKLVNWR